ncbi:hypothetical protein HRbin26_00162 [bacterium HR26]|nr:hypothetical protein HRbin26_00162 [bacterium HR26]
MQRGHAGNRRRRSDGRLASSRRRPSAAGIGLLVALLPEIASAHVRWFVPQEQQLQLPDWSLLTHWPTPAVLGLSLALWLVLKGLERLVGTPHFPNPPLLAHMEPHATTVLALQTGISLVWFAYQRTLFVPSLTLPPSWLGWLLVVLQLVVAFTFITSLFDRAGAALLVLVFLLGFALFPPEAMLEQLLYVGIAIAIFVLGVTIPPARVARRLLPLARYERQAVSALRVLTGCSLVIVAFSEKLLNPNLSPAFLQEYPHFNVLRSLFGWSWMTDRLFGDLAGVVEATIGLLLISGVLTRVVILAMWVPFNLTVPLLPPIELLGHLPIFGIMYLLLLYGSGVAPETAARRLEPALTGELEASRRRIRGEDDSRSADRGKTA